jgi:hypothetical protein
VTTPARSIDNAHTNSYGSSRATFYVQSIYTRQPQEKEEVLYEVEEEGKGL